LISAAGASVPQLTVR